MSNRGGQSAYVQTGRNADTVRQFSETREKMQSKLDRKGKKDGKLTKAEQARKTRDEAEIDFTEHLMNLDELADACGTHLEQGLSTNQAASILARDGKNELTPPPSTPIWLQFFRHLTGFFSLLLWLAAVLCFIAYGLQPEGVENLYLGIVLSVVTIMTGIFSFYQDHKSQKVMEGFAKFQPPKANVIRDGRQTEVAAADIVRGDIVTVRAGDKIPADIRVIASASFEVDNSSLTGESDAQKRTADNSNPNPLHATNIAFFGTLCQKGNCTGCVIATGDRSVIGKIAFLAATTGAEDTPIAKEIEHFIHIVSGVAVFLGATFLIISFAKGNDALDSLVFCIGIIVANVPEGLLATVTVSLTLTAQRMAQKNVLVKNLEAVETLGSTTCIASDKTGTLTQNKMTVVHLHYDESTVLATSHFGVEQGQHPKTFERLHMIMTLCCNATFVENGSNSKRHDLPVNGDASEAAFIKFAEQIYPIAKYRKDYPRIHELPFNSANKFMCTINLTHADTPAQQAADKRLLLIKGGADVVIRRCGFIMVNGKPEKLNDERRAAYFRGMEDMMENGERVLACAMATLDPVEFPYDAAAPNDPAKSFQFENDVEGTGKPNYPIDEWMAPYTEETRPQICLVGMVALIDPPRPMVPKAVQDCQSAGIQVIMVTGDHKTTAAAIARQVHIIRGKTRRDLARELKCEESEIDRFDSRLDAIVITGDELKTIDDRTLDKILDFDEIVFARTSPTQKLIIVEGLQQKKYKRRGLADGKTRKKVRHVVAVTGDGVNDSPALRKADIGVAMGIAGTEVAKNAADMILLDDDFSSIVLGVEEGRLIFDNLKKSIAYTLSSNIPEISPFLVFIITSIPLPLPTVLILCIDLGTDMVPAISLAYENAEADIMAKPPRDGNVERLVTAKLVSFSYLQVGVVQALAGFFTYFIVLFDYGFHPKNLMNVAEFFELQNIRNCSEFNGNADRQCLYETDPHQPGAGGFELEDCNVGYPNDPDWPCHNPEEALAHAQCAFFISIIVVQWADLTACKTRTLSLMSQGMRNSMLNFGLLFETVLGVILCYVTFLNSPLGTRPIHFTHWLPALPFCILILFYDETRKFLLRSLGKDNWVFVNTYY